jgi:hypothetical protein
LGGAWPLPAPPPSVPTFITHLLSISFVHLRGSYKFNDKLKKKKKKKKERKKKKEE